VNITPEWRAEISALSIEPPPPTDRTEERMGTVYRDQASQAPELA